MKVAKIALTFLIAMIFFLACSGIGPSIPKISSPIIGTWSGTFIYPIYYQFNENHFQ